MVRQKRRLVGLFTVVLMSFAACDDEPTAALRAAIAEGCTINSECANPLVCAFRTCHIECESSRDCAKYGGGLCVQSDKPYKVCQNPNEKVCVRNSDCPGNLICGPDAKCRDACATDRDCLTGQKCAAGACADEPDLVEGKLPSKTSSEAGLSCLRPSDCPGDLVCKFNTCVVECVTAKDCEDGLPCTASRCEKPPVGAPGRGGASGSGGAAGASTGGSGGNVSTGGAAGSTSGGSGGAGNTSGSSGAAGRAGNGGATAGTGGSNAGNAGSAGAGAGGGGMSAGPSAGSGGSDAGAGGSAAGSGGSDAGSAGAGGGGAGNSSGVAGSGGSDAGSAGIGGSAGSGGSGNPPPLGRTVLANTKGATYIALDRDNVYWLTVEGTAPTTKGTVYAVPKLGGDVVTISAVTNPVALGLDDTNVFWGESAEFGNIFRRNKTQPEKPQNVTKAIPFLTDFAVEGGDVVFTDKSSVSLIDLVVAANNRILVGGATSGYTMTRRGGFAYWADAQPDTVILRAPIGPTAIKVGEALLLAKAPKTKPQGIAVDATRVFWTEPETRQVRSALSTGGGEQTLITDTVAPYEIALDDERVYWTGVNNVSSMKKDGSDRVTYDSKGKDHRAIAVDDTWVFWLDAAIGTVNRIGK